MEQELMRVGISLPENLLNKFDEIILQRGYSSRSEGVRDAIRSYIVNFEWMSGIPACSIGEGGGRLNVVILPGISDGAAHSRIFSRPLPCIIVRTRS